MRARHHATCFGADGNVPAVMRKRRLRDADGYNLFIERRMSGGTFPAAARHAFLHRTRVSRGLSPVSLDQAAFNRHR